MKEAGDPIEYWDSIFCICKGDETCIGCLIRDKIIQSFGDDAINYTLRAIDRFTEKPGGKAMSKKLSKAEKALNRIDRMLGKVNLSKDMSSKIWHRLVNIVGEGKR